MGAWGRAVGEVMEVVALRSEWGPGWGCGDGMGWDGVWNRDGGGGVRGGRWCWGHELGLGMGWGWWHWVCSGLGCGMGAWWA